MKTMLEQLMADILVTAKELDFLIAQHANNSTSVIQRYSSDAEKEAARTKILETKQRFMKLTAQLDVTI